MITMYDSAQNDQFPPDAQAVAGYADGSIGDQPNFGWLVRHFPGAHHLSIALSGSHDADCLDIEQYAANPSDAAAWYARQKARGIARPCFYASASLMESAILPVIKAAGFPREEIRLWSAHYGAGMHICGPRTCGLMSQDADGTQWNDRALGRNLDESVLLDNFFDSASQGWVSFDMNRLPVLRQGDTDQPGQFWSVHRLQALLGLAGQLNSITAANIAADGAFGPKTKAAVEAVQLHYGLATDGIAGAQTWSILLTGRS